ncbi:MAG: tetratricopeptide repeat protein [Gammaproteobacteria bacterium]
MGDDKDGQQLLEEAKHRNLIQFSTVFMMLTAENTMQMVMGAVEYHPDDYLSKPFNKDTLRQRLEKVMFRKSDFEEIEKLVQKGKLAQAIRLCDERIGKQPKNIREFQKLKGELCLQLEHYEEAETHYEEILAGRATPWARLGLGKVYYHSGRFREARQCFQGIIEENKHNMEAYDWLARTLLELGEIKEAQASLQTAARLSPKAILRQMALGDLALKRDDHETATRAFKKAVKLGEHSVYKTPANYTKQAQAMIHTSAKKDALRVLKKLRKDFPHDEQASIHAALAENTVFTSLNREQEARQAYQEARQLFEKTGGQLPTELVLEMSKACINNGDEARGTELIKDLVRNHHEDEALLRQVQETFAEMGMEEEGRQLISDSRDKVVKLNNRGVRLVQQGKLEEAISLFEEALQDLPANKTINMNTAMVLLKYMEQHGCGEHHVELVRRCLEMVRECAPRDTTLQQLQTRFNRVTKSHAA